MNVIERIRQLKNERGWTDYRLAQEALIPQSTLASVYERNTPPKLDVLEQLCHAFGPTLAQFFREEEEPQLLTREETALLERYRTLPPAVPFVIPNRAEGAGEESPRLLSLPRGDSSSRLLLGMTWGKRRGEAAFPRALFFRHTNLEISFLRRSMIFFSRREI